MEYKFDIIHKDGAKHQAADAVSRLNTKETDDSDNYDHIPLMAIAMHEQRRLGESNNNTPE